LTAALKKTLGAQRTFLTMLLRQAEKSHGGHYKGGPSGRPMFHRHPEIYRHFKLMAEEVRDKKKMSK
jgi:hypothetical protein